MTSGVHNTTIQVLPIQRCLLGSVNHSTKVTRLNNNYHCRVFVDNILNQEYYCTNKSMIGSTIREMLRWEDKCGNISKLASSSREREK
jgi:hypothetical protein